MTRRPPPLRNDHCANCLCAVEWHPNDGPCTWPDCAKAGKCSGFRSRYANKAEPVAALYRESLVSNRTPPEIRARRVVERRLDGPRELDIVEPDDIF